MELVELHPQLTMLQFPVGHAYVWRGPDGLTLVDSGVPGSGPRIAEAIATLGDLRRILLTHCHEDHVGGAAFLAASSDEVEVIAHRLDAPVVRGESATPPPILSDWERDLLERVHAGMPSEPPSPVQVDREVDDGDELDLGGGVSAVCIGVPGHTPGSVAYYLPEPRILFTGDTIARTDDGTVILGVFNTDPARAADSFRRQSQLDVDIACFGHGLPLTTDAGPTLRAAARPPA